MRFIYLLFFCQCYFAQNYSSQWYTSENGLPQNSIKDIIKDKYGFIWLSTENGIIRYDGRTFTQYDRLNVNNLNFTDFDGSISKDSIFVSNNIETNDILIHNRSPKIIHLKRKEKLLFNAKGNYFNRLLKNIGERDYYNDTQYFIKINSDRYSFHKGFILYEDGKVKKKIPIQHFNNKHFRNIFAHNETLFLADPAKRKIHKMYKGSVVTMDDTSLITAPESKIYWQQTNNQAFVVNHQKIYFVEYKNEKPRLKFLVEYKDIENFPLNSIYYDQEFDKLYLGSPNKGLNIISLSNFYVAIKKVPFSDEVYYSSLPFGKNAIITSEGRVFDHNGVVKKYDFGNYNDNHLLLYDESSNILLRNRNHSHIVRFKKNHLYKKVDSLGFGNQRVYPFSKKGKLYPLSLLNLNESKLHFFDNDQFKNPLCTFFFKSLINAVEHYKNKDYIIGCSNGVYLVSINNKKIKRIGFNINAKSIIHTKDGNFWVTSNSGFYLLKNEKLIKMPNDKDNYLSSAHYILEDPFGFFWISSNNGLFKVQKKQLLNFANNQKSKVNYYRFTKRDGFLINEFNGNSNPNALILENGEFVFPSMQGFVFFKPDSIRTYYPNKDRIYIERAKINNGVVINFRNNLTLPNNYNTADIFLDIPYYKHSDNLSIDAKIEGKADSQWEQVKIGNERKYSISGLEPGEYNLTFRVLVSSNGNYEYRNIHLTIKPLFFQTMIFKVIVIGLLIIILVFILLRINFLKVKNKKQQELIEYTNVELEETFLDLESAKKKLNFEIDYQEKLIYSINHDITTPVKFIIYLSKQITQMEDVNMQKKYFDSIYRSAEELHKFTSSLKEYTQLYKESSKEQNERIKINDAIEFKKMLFNEIAKENGTTIFNDVNANFIIRINKITFETIIHNLLDNAVKNTKDGTIIINNISDSDAGISLQIKDTGTGMSQEQIDYYNSLNDDHDFTLKMKNFGIGLHLVIYLVKKINANIHFAKNYPNGTIVTLSLKNN